MLTSFCIQLTGDAFTGVAFMRNAVSIGIPFAITPWINRNGIQNMFIIAGFISLGVTGLMIPMMMWGKNSRRALAPRYHEMVRKQGYSH
jgi:high-affinity Fe2+/Pb2+ permease